MHIIYKYLHMYVISYSKMFCWWFLHIFLYIFQLLVFLNYLYFSKFSRICKFWPSSAAYDRPLLRNVNTKNLLKPMHSRLQWWNIVVSSTKCTFPQKVLNGPIPNHFPVITFSFFLLRSPGSTVLPKSSSAFYCSKTQSVVWYFTYIRQLHNIYWVNASCSPIWCSPPFALKRRSILASRKCLLSVPSPKTRIKLC